MIIKRMTMMFRNLLAYVKSFFVLFMSCSIAVSVLGVYTISINSIRVNEIHKAKNAFGNYNFSVNESDRDKREQLIEKSSAKRVRDVSYVISDVEQSVYSYINIYDADSDFFEDTEFSLLQGRAPENEDEIAIEKWYMLNLGVDSNSMLGSTVDIYDEDGTKRQVTVTGILQVNKDRLDDGYNKTVYAVRGGVPNEDAHVCHILYFMYDIDSDTDDILHDIESMESLYDEYDFFNITENYYVKKSLETYEMGDDTATKAILFVIFIILMLIVYNTIKIVLKKCMSSIVICKILGVKMWYIVLSLYIICILAMSAAMVTGVSVSIIIVRYIFKLSLGWFGIGVVPQMVVPYGIFTKVLLCLIAMITVICLYIWMKFSCNAPQEFVVGQFTGITFSSRTKCSTLYNDILFPRLKRLYRNYLCHMFNNTIMALTVAIALYMAYLLVIQAGEQIKDEKNNDNFSYRIDFSREIFINEEREDTVVKLYEDIKDILEKYDTQFCIYEDDHKNISLPIEVFDEEYIDYLVKEYGYDKNTLYQSKVIEPVNIVIMGYTDEMIEKVCEENELEANDIGWDNLLVVNRMVYDKGNKNTRVNMVGQKVTLYKNTIVCDDFGRFEGYKDDVLRVAAEVKSGLLYHNSHNEEDSIVFIMREAAFNELLGYGGAYPDYIYFSSDSNELIDELYSCVSGTSYAEMINQDDENRQKRINYYQTLVMYFMIVVLCVISVLFNLLLISQFEISANRRNIAMEYILGIRKSTQWFIYSLESLAIYIVGIVMGIAGIWVIDSKANRINTINNTRIIIEEALKKKIEIGVIITVVICVMIMSVFTWIQIKRIRIPDDVERL